MLGQRVATAIVLLAVLAAALSADSAWPVVLLLALAAACTAWEWLRLVWPWHQGQGVGPVCAGLAVMLGLIALAVAGEPTGWQVPSLPSWPVVSWGLGAVALIWLVAGTTVVVRGRVQVPASSVAGSVFALLATVSTWWVLTQFYVRQGGWFLVSLMALVWVADIGAYFVGKRWGRRKLAPRVSPGKTLEGALGGLLAAAIWVGVSSLWPGSFAALLVQQGSLPGALLLALLLAAVSIMGDLYESLLKRRAGVKDSSALLPGHGGVYDRIDALLPVSVCAWVVLELMS